MLVRMEVERVISQVEWLERVFALPDTRPLNARDIAAANRRHDEMLAQSPWFRLRQRYGVCCRSESTSVRFGEIEGYKDKKSSRFQFGFNKFEPRRVSIIPKKKPGGPDTVDESW